MRITLELTKGICDLKRKGCNVESSRSEVRAVLAAAVREYDAKKDAKEDKTDQSVTNVRYDMEHRGEKPSLEVGSATSSSA